MYKKILCTMLAAMCAVSLVSCGNSGSSSSTNSSSSASSDGASTAESTDTSIDFDGDAYNVHFMYLVAAEGADQDQIVDKANELTMENLNMTVDMIPMTFGAYSTTISTMLAANEPLDMFPAYSSNFPTYIDSGYMVNLNDYEAYLTGVKEQMGDAYYAGTVGDFLCGFTEMKEWGFPDGIICRKDVLDELGINADDIKIDPDDYSSYQQLDDLFAKVKEAKPGMIPFGGGGSLAAASYSWYDGLGNDFGVLANYAQDKTITNWFESDQYYQLCNIHKRWFDAGYTSADIVTNQDSGETLMKAGNLFSFSCYYKPNTTVEKLAQTGYETVVIPITKEGIKSNASISSLSYCLANAAEDKTKAAQFMNFAYTNGDFNDLINWGLEGTDWVEDENGQATYPDGVDATSVQTHNDFGWGLPNQFVGHAWAGNPIDIWDQYREYNDSMLKSVAYGFSFDSTVVTDQVTQCSSVYSEYQKQLAFGGVDDLKASIKEFNDKLYAAGLQDIMDAKQEQLDAWFAENKN